MHLAARLGREIDLLLYILFGADVNGVHGGSTALHRACYFGHAECVTYLVAAGANRNARDVDGKTPRDWAQERGHLDCVQVLDAA